MKQPSVYKLPESLLKVLADYMKVRSEQKDHEAKARVKKQMADSMQAKIVPNMGTSLLAKCGIYLAHLKPTAKVLASFTLADGTMVYMQDLVSLTYRDGKDTKVIKAKDIAKFYGGRSEYDTLTVTKIPQ